MKKIVRLRGLVMLSLFAGVVTSIRAIDQEYSLLDAAKNGDLASVVLLVENGAAVNKRDDLGRDACDVAIGCGYFDIAYYLTDVKDFLAACKNGDKEKVIKIVTSKDSRVKLSLGLPIAVKSGSVDMVQYLLENGADVNAKSRKGLPPICCTLSDAFVDDDNYIAIVKLFIEYGADTTTVYSLPKGHFDILRLTAAYGRAGILEVLLNHGVLVDGQDPVNGNTALHYAVDFDGGFESTQVLVRYGADIFKKNANGAIPRDLAISLSATYLACIEDFYDVIASKMTFEAFANKYFETEYVGDLPEYLGNKEKIIWIRDILHLADKSFADKFYEWASKSTLCKEDKLCFKDKSTMYVKILKRAVDFGKNIEMWYGLGSQQNMPKKSRKELKRTFSSENSNSGPLRKKFCGIQSHFAHSVLPLVVSGFKSSIPTDLKIVFKK